MGTDNAGPLIDTLLYMQGEGCTFMELSNLVRRTWVMGLGEDPDSLAGKILILLLYNTEHRSKNIYERVRPHYTDNTPGSREALLSLIEKGLVDSRDQGSYRWSIRIAHKTRMFK